MSASAVGKATIKKTRMAPIPSEKMKLTLRPILSTTLPMNTEPKAIEPRMIKILVPTKAGENPRARR